MKATPIDGMTKYQRAAIEAISKNRFNSCNTTETHEWKEFSINATQYFVSVYCTFGRKGDEGTAAEVFCRERGHFFIGPMGKIEAKVYKKGTKKADLKRHPLIYGWSN